MPRQTQTTLLVASLLSVSLVALPVRPVLAAPYTVALTGVLNSVTGTGTFDSSVHSGTPFSFVFTWDTAIPLFSRSMAPNAETIWTSQNPAYGATARFGDYGSDPMPTSNFDNLVKSPIVAPGGGSQGISYESSGVVLGPPLAGSNLDFVTAVTLSPRLPGTGFTEFDQNPQDDWDITKYGSAVFYLGYYKSTDIQHNPSYFLQGQITGAAVTVGNAVPEGSPLSLLAVGVLALPLLRSRRLRQG